MASKKFPSDYAALERNNNPEDVAATWKTLAITTHSILNQIDEEGKFPEDDHVATLASIADFVLSYLKATSPQHADDAEIDEDVIHPMYPIVVEEMVIALNGRMKQIHDEPLRCKVFNIMETCLLDRRIDPEHVVADTLLVAVHHCLNPPNVKEHKSWIKKCWNLADFFDMIELSSCTDFYHTILLLARPDIMNVEDGRKLLASLFLLSEQTTVDLHQILRRSLLDFQRRNIWEAIGDVYYRAYMMSDGLIRMKLDEIVQWYMETSVKCQDEKVFVRVLCVLDAFHSGADNKVIMGLLDTGYGPVLFRALDYPNDSLRKNALRVLAHAFPIRSPDQPRQEASKRYEEQFGKLISFFHDKNPSIRAEAVECVCGVLQRHWLLIGPATAVPHLNTIFNDLANDSSNKAVRLSVLKGAEMLLEHHLTHQHMKRLIPSLRPCLNDAASIVRLAFVRLLKNISQIRHIAFWEAASIPHLIERMGRDPSEHVVEELVSLLLHNFLPATSEPTEQLERCVFLIKLDKVAAMQFYTRARRHCKDATAIFTLLRILTDWCCSCMEAKVGSKGSAKTDTAGPPAKKAKTAAKKGKASSKKTEIAPEQTPPEDSVDSMKAHVDPSKACMDDTLLQSTLHVIGCMVKSIHKDWEALPHEHTQALSKNLNTLITKMPEAYPLPDMASSCTWLSAGLPGHKSAPTDCLASLTALMAAGKPSTEECNIQWRLQLLSACMGGQLTEVLGTIAKRLKNGEPNTVPLRFLTYLLVNQQTRPQVISAWASDSKGPMEAIASALHTYVTKRVPGLLEEEGGDDAVHKYAVTACNLLSRLVLHGHYLTNPEEAGGKTDGKAKSKKAPAKAHKAAETGCLFSAGELLQFYLEKLLPSAVDCFASSTADTRTVTGSQKRGRKGPGSAKAAPKSTVDDFKAQICETVIFWTGEMTGCGLIKTSTKPASDACEDASQPTSSMAVQDPQILARLLKIISQLSVTGSITVRLRLLQLVYKLQFGNPEAETKKALIQAAVNVLKKLSPSSPGVMSADCESMANMVLGMARIARTNARDAQTFFDELMAAALQMINADPSGFKPDAEVAIPRVVRILKKACASPEYTKILQLHVAQVKQGGNAVPDAESLLMLWRYLAKTEGADGQCPAAGSTTPHNARDIDEFGNEPTPRGQDS